MDSKIFVAAFVIVCSFDMANALMCYNCSQVLNPTCGPMIGDAMGIEQVTCVGQCVTSKVNTMIGVTEVTAYDRSCQTFCFEACLDIPDAGVKTCSKCCKTDLCNANYGEPTPGPTPDPNAASHGVVNLVTVLFTLLLCATMA